MLMEPPAHACADALGPQHRSLQREQSEDWANAGCTCCLVQNVVLHCCLQALITAHKPSPLPLPTLASALGFETVQEAGAYAEEQGAVVDWGPEGSAGSGSNGVLDTKLSAARPVGPPAPPAEQQQQQKAAAGAARQVGPQPALQQQTAKHKKHQEDEGAEGQKKKKKKKG